MATLKSHAQVLGETGKIGDLRGVFFDVANESLISGLRITGMGVTATKFAEDRVTDLGSGNNGNGSIVNEFDVGVASGTAGIGKDDIREASFILSHKTAGLSYDFLAVQDFAVRLTSAGSEGGARNDSLKLGGTSPEPADVNAPPEALDDATATDEDTPVSVMPQVLASPSSRRAGAPDWRRSAPMARSSSTPRATSRRSGNGEFDTVAVLYEMADGNGGTDTARGTVFIHGVNARPWRWTTPIRACSTSWRTTRTRRATADGYPADAAARRRGLDRRGRHSDLRRGHRLLGLSRERRPRSPSTTRPRTAS